MINQDQRELFNKIGATAQKIINGEADLSALDKYNLDDVYRRAKWPKDEHIQNICQDYYDKKTSKTTLKDRLIEVATGVSIKIVTTVIIAFITFIAGIIYWSSD